MTQTIIFQSLCKMEVNSSDEAYATSTGFRRAVKLGDIKRTTGKIDLYTNS